MSIKSNQAGRSMIEMLGVLAIVGVLSAGAIAEFGKAMFRWKAIKCTEEYNLFISEMLVYEKDWIKMMSKQRPFIYRTIYGRMGDAAVLMDCIWKSFF